MKITSLEINGFKSFYNKTKIRFHNQLSAIVGPNGCGKSNVIDAIRWILGEQNPRLLRAEVMEQLISNGSELLKPVGMAEVSLVLEQVPKYNFEEVEIKRRVFRSGESEYYLNGVSCRLKDITDIFIDTGSGARTHSIIGQGSVDKLITAKPEEKRTLIEEVAGIRKYKIRRRETETRIKTTKENLSRVQDMANEVKRQMDTLSLQAKQAEQFGELSEEASKLESIILNAKLFKLVKRKDTILDEKTKIEKNISDTEKESIQITNHLKTLNVQFTNTEESLKETEQETNITRINLQTRQSSQELLKNEASSIDKFIEKIESEAVLLSNETGKIAEQFQSKRDMSEHVKEDLEKEEAEITEKENILISLKSKHSESRDNLRNLRTSLFKTLNEYSSLKGSALGHEKELNELISRKSQIKNEHEELLQEEKSATRDISNLENLSKENESRKQNITETNDKLEVNLTSLNEKQRLIIEKSDSLKEELNELNSRLNALLQIQSNYEWLPEGIRNFILKNKGQGVLGTFSDFISVPEGYERAVETALGDTLKWILVEESSQAITAIDSLKQDSIGRGTFISVKDERIHTELYKSSENMKSLFDIVQIENIRSNIIERTLKKVFLAPTLDEALEARKGANDSSSFVTIEGDCLHANGAISGGPTQPGVLERKREIENLRIKINELKTEIEKLASEIESNENEIKTINERITEYKNRLIEIDIKEAETRKDIINLKGYLEKIVKRIEHVTKNLEQINNDTSEKTSLIEESKSKIQLLDVEKIDLEQKLTAIEEKIQQEEQEERTFERDISDRKVTCASLREKERSLYEDLVELDIRRADINKRIELESTTIEEKKQEKLNLIEKEGNTLIEIEDLNNKLRKKEEELTLKNNERRKFQEEITITSEKREALNSQLSEIRLKNNSFELDLNTVQIEIENITDTLRKNDLYDMDNKTEMSPEEEKELLETDLNIEGPRLRRLQQKIERFGPVNLLAPQEYNKLEERYTFLTEQMDDLTQAIASLAKAISKIDKESEKRFNEAFEVMNEKFQEIFARLFRGGEGKLILTDEDNILETGVEVMVRPRGKKFQSINLLSGGEKALSAIALIISACLIKPAPFLLFDEIDAPLDDKNTSYFMELIKEIDKNSQVVLITHNKKTMQEVQSLIGITSNKSGTSSVVAVDLN
ncbi:MAG: chromosome partition protein Smc [Thermodesulfobacteriota bacterium]|nr:MAG: chromosome partition protein Smc [Thermodesulfobacteriota bacterium]